MRYAYPCVLAPEEDGGFSVSFPDVPEALTCGDDRAEALEMAEDALAVALSVYVEAGEAIPEPGAAEGRPMVAVPPAIAAKLALHAAMRAQGLGPAALAARLGVGEESVRVLLDPGRRSPIERVEAALRAVGRGLVVEDRAA